ncbi:hypothetical protein CQW23_01591 [Capsicum baccatum]|uniref:F-box associated beta-propeller type 3 domain-containing protein n=1 Tax=Capsicum baccatum TaxID=33114 RepID=A0A2G2XP22_CAPBA|nr:hypothetical protein CQW23_01591 [Capsicum baccatum]
MSVVYHLSKDNVVADALSRLSMGSIAHVEDGNKKLAQEVHQPAQLGVRLVDSVEGFEPEAKTYKVLSTTYHIQERYTKHWVLTLRVDDSWREIKHPPSIFSKPGVYINGVIYTFDFHNGLAIAAFDVKSEKFKIIALWNTSPWKYNYELIEVKGKLAIIDYGEGVIGYFDLWILEQTQKREWKRFIIPFPSIRRDIQYSIRPSFASHDGEIVVVVNLKSGVLCCLCYDITRKSWRELEIKGLPKDHSIE